MRKADGIRKFLAVALLLAFVVGVTPKVYFHDFFSNHADYFQSDSKSKGVSISSFKFNCGIFNIEGLSPFLETDPFIFDTNHLSFANHSSQCVQNWITLKANQTQHRGPPQPVVISTRTLA